MISVLLEGDKELIYKLDTFIGRITPGLAREVTRLSLEGQRLSQQKVSGQVLKVRTGALRSSINAAPTKVSGSRITGGWGTNIKYARYQEYGVPHSWEIRPKSARALAFEVNGQTIFAMHVTHPPLPERSFLRSALREMEPRIREGLENAVGRLGL